MTDGDWGSLIAKFLHLRWMLRWMIPSAFLMILHTWMDTPLWLVLLPPIYWYGRSFLLTSILKWTRKVDTTPAESVSLQGSMLKEDLKSEAGKK